MLVNITKLKFYNFYSLCYNITVLEYNLNLLYTLFIDTGAQFKINFVYVYNKCIYEPVYASIRLFYIV